MKRAGHLFPALDTHSFTESYEVTDHYGSPISRIWIYLL
jgi:hypothetical protein